MRGKKAIAVAVAVSLLVLAATMLMVYVLVRYFTGPTLILGFMAMVLCFAAICTEVKAMLRTTIWIPEHTSRKESEAPKDE